MREGRCIHCGTPFRSAAHNTIMCRGAECERTRQRMYRRRLRASDVDADNERVAAWRRKSRVLLLLTMARSRAKAHGIPFAITAADIQIPATCPVLGIPLFYGERITLPNSPSVDRIDPSMGYVPGNVLVISHKANRIKSNATLADLVAIVEYVRQHQGRAAHVA